MWNKMVICVTDFICSIYLAMYTIPSVLAEMAHYLLYDHDIVKD